MKSNAQQQSQTDISVIWNKYLVGAVQQWKAEIIQPIVALMLGCNYITLQAPRVCIKNGAPEVMCSFFKGRAFFHISAGLNGFSIVVRELEDDGITGKVFLVLREECLKRNTIEKVTDLNFVKGILKSFILKVQEAGIDAIN
jgi:hypothetical protein